MTAMLAEPAEAPQEATEATPDPVGVVVPVSPVVKALNDAADHMEKVGYVKGMFFAVDGCYESDREYVAETFEAPCCALGALRVASGYQKGLFDYQSELAPGASTRWAFYKAEELFTSCRRALRYAVPHERAIPEWNDDADTTAEDVIKAFRKAAQFAELEDL